MILTTHTIGTPVGVFQANWDEDEDIPVSYTGDPAAILFFRSYLDLAAPSARGGALVRFDALEPEDLGFIDVENAPVVVLDPLEQLDDSADMDPDMKLVLDSTNDGDVFALIGEGTQLLAGLDENSDSFFDDLTRLREIIQAFADAAPVVEPVIEPAPEPLPALPPSVTVDVDSLPGAVTSEMPFDDVSDTSRWLVMNAPRPLVGDSVLDNGPFLSGRFWALIDLSDAMAGASIASNRQNGAGAVLYADKATQTAMALNLADPDYLPAYLEMDAEELAGSIGGLTSQLREGKTYGELKALAAKGMPTVAAVDPVIAPEPAAPGGKVFANEPQHYLDSEMGTRRYRVMGGKLTPNTPAARRYLEYPVVGSNADYVAQNARLERKGDTFQLTYDLDRPFPTTVEVEGDPTAESVDYQAGFNEGMAAQKPKLTDAMIRKNTEQWTEGYRAALRDRTDFPEMAARDREEILSYLASVQRAVEPEPVIEPAPVEPAPAPDLTPAPIEPMDFSQFLAPAARSLADLREIDIYRVLLKAPDGARAGLAQWIIDNRADLAAEVLRVLAEEWPALTGSVRVAEPAPAVIDDRSEGLAEPLPEGGVIVPPATGEGTASTPERDADMAFLKAIVSGEIDLAANDPYDRIEAIVHAYANDEAMAALAREAIDVYVNDAAQAMNQA